MKKVIQIFCIFFLVVKTVSAQYINKQWVFGYEYEPDYKVGMNCIDFNDHKIEVYPYDYQDDVIFMAFSSAFINDNEGKIALLSDNCSIYDKELHFIEGGEKMHDNDFSHEYCKDHIHFYVISKSNIFFPYIKEKDHYFQLYKDVYATDVKLVSSNIMLNKIGFNSQNKLAIQSHDTIDDKRYQSIAIINPTLNKNKDAWWIFNLGEDTNEYSAYLLNDNKLDTMHKQKIGRKINERSITVNGSIFSPDNKTMIQLINGIGLQVFDFDDATGMFSNAREIKVRIDTFKYWSFGMCYSPNSRFVYVGTGGSDEDPPYLNYLYQIDLWDNSVEQLATFYQSDETGWDVGIGSISRGPDCRLYVSPGSTSHWMHVIHYPDEEGVACGFQPMAIDMPYRVGKVLPNFMQGGSECDPTYEWPFALATQTPVEELLTDINMSPNPGRDIVFLNSEKIQPSLWTLDLYNMNGKLMKLMKGINSYITQIDISDLSAAVYIYKVSDRDGRLLKVGRLIKI